MLININAGQLRALEELSRDITTYSIGNQTELEINIGDDADQNTEIKKMVIQFSNAPFSKVKHDYGYSESFEEGYDDGYKAGFDMANQLADSLDAIQSLSAVDDDDNDSLIDSLEELELADDFKTYERLADHYEQCKGCELCEDYFDNYSVSPF